MRDMTFALSIWVLTVLYKYKLSTPSPRRAIIVNISNKEEGQEGKEWRVGVGGGGAQSRKTLCGRGMGNFWDNTIAIKISLTWLL